ncbi:MAG: hypothetical protein CVV11_13810 [Gammaproteobacteria bacterium HGW-Gammaproteobacteria-15]|nr:MAG: hypothetical protein CVV11_13810 [Gammaproteobacteria bacterium HGW-Gammaproteobacteria-15]
MALSNAYTEAYGKLGEFFNKLRDGQAPPQFTHQFLIDLGFKSNKQRAYIPLLKALGFLTPDGKPTARYKDYRDHSQSKRIMGEALKEAYADIFLIKENPTSADHATVEGKFKSYHNASDNVALNMRRTFFALLDLADLKGKPTPKKASESAEDHALPHVEPAPPVTAPQVHIKTPGLHYNIQIHLPATKDIEVYNAIFKSLKEHLF